MTTSSGGTSTRWPRVPALRGYVSFYNEKVDIYVDGQLEDRPKTVFS